MRDVNDLIHRIATISYDHLYMRDVNDLIHRIATISYSHPSLMYR
jgi:hypothetical protein